MKCTKCRGVGKFLPPEGITKADLILCNICSGTGVRPEGYKPKTKHTPNKIYLSKKDGIETLRNSLKDDAF